MIRNSCLILFVVMALISCQKDGYYISKQSGGDRASTNLSKASVPSGITYKHYRGLYIDSTSYILGDSLKERSLLRWCKDQGINTLSFYDLKRCMTLAKAGHLSRFLKMAKTQYGIKENTAVVGSDVFLVSYLDTFNRSKRDTLERFNTINLEKEWWNGDGTFKNYVKILNRLKQWSQAQTPRVKTEEYIGWLIRPSGKELYMANALVENSDRILVHAYQKNLAFQYVLNRLSYLGQAAKAQGKVFPVVIIFSAEPNFSADYFRTHNFEDAYTLIAKGYLSSDFPGKENVKLIGYQIFDQSYARNVRPLL